MSGEVPASRERYENCLDLLCFVVYIFGNQAADGVTQHGALFMVGERFSLSLCLIDSSY